MPLDRSSFKFRKTLLAVSLVTALAGAGADSHADGAAHHASKLIAAQRAQTRQGFAAMRQRVRDHQAGKTRSNTLINGAVIVVQNCNDSGPGSLRQAFTDAVDGTTIDATGLTQCQNSTISLATGLSTFADVALKGPGRDVLTLSTAGNGRVIDGKYLQISDITIADGAAEESGGCIRATDG